MRGTALEGRITNPLLSGPGLEGQSAEGEESQVDA